MYRMKSMKGRHTKTNMDLESPRTVALAFADIYPPLYLEANDRETSISVPSDSHLSSKCDSSVSPSYSRDDATRNAALLLTAVAEIANKEVSPRTQGSHANTRPCWNEIPPHLERHGIEGHELQQRIGGLPAPPLNTLVHGNKLPTTSSMKESPDCLAPKLEPRAENRKTNFSTNVLPSSLHSNRPTLKKLARVTLHKKFSWRTCPELEAFLLANRDEYIRHSALNYTTQQKQFNNALTQQMIELANKLGYLFDDHEFSFITLRDRIRCYYKSYVQSLKKKGVVVGYAARRAGLVTQGDTGQRTVA